MAIYETCHTNENQAFVKYACDIIDAVVSATFYPDTFCYIN